MWPCQQAAHLYNRSIVTADFTAAAIFMESQPKAQETAQAEDAARSSRKASSTARSPT